MAIDWANLGVVQIPWVHRRHIGRWRAYWRTVWWGTFRVSRLAEALAGPVALADARAFRRTTAMLAGLFLAAGALIAELFLRFDPTQYLQRTYSWGMTVPAPPSPAADLLLPLIAAYTVYFCYPLGAIVFLFLASGSAQTWFERYRPTHMIDDRGVALANYAAAPLAGLPIAVVLAMPATVINIIDVPIPYANLIAVSALLSVLVVVGIVLLWWRNTFRLLRRCTELTGPRRWVVGLTALPLGWIVAAIIGLVAVPWIGGYLSLVVASLF